MRELQTIGLLGTSPLGRSGMRRRMRTIGASNPNFVAPGSGVYAQSAGQPLIAAAFVLQNQMDAYGVPNEHTADQATLAFQQAWNADPVSHTNGLLDEDGSYGPNSQAALDSITGLAQPPNTSTPSPTPGPAPAPIAPVTPATPTAPGEGSHSVAAWIAVAGVGAAIWYFFFRKKSRKAGGHRRPAAQTTIQVNGRRKAARRR